LDYIVQTSGGGNSSFGKRCANMD